jgi:hypothetical protein
MDGACTLHDIPVLPSGFADMGNMLSKRDA